MDLERRRTNSSVKASDRLGRQDWTESIPVAEK
jgi:hypothetical protein